MFLMAGLKRPTATWVLLRRLTGVNTFRNFSISITVNFKFELVDQGCCCFVLDSFIPQRRSRLEGTDYLKIASVNLEGLLWSFRSTPLFRNSTDSWMGFPGDLLLSDPPRNYRWLSIMTILNFMVHRSCSTGTPTPQLPEDFWNVK